jgi:CheY-like chemotaxis protein
VLISRSHDDRSPFSRTCGKRKENSIVLDCELLVLIRTSRIQSEERERVPQNEDLTFTGMAPTWLRPPRVFVLDDEKTIADTLARILELHDCQAVAMYTAATALEAALNQPPDLLIADVALRPDSINGIDLAIYFERVFPQSKVLLISGHAAAANLHDTATAAGHNFPLLTKPVTPEEVLNTVGEMLAHLRIPDRGGRTTGSVQKHGAI